MILLVRCCDNTCSVALKSRLNDLVAAGLVTSFLRNGEWVAAEKTGTRRACAKGKKTTALLAPLAAHP